MMRPLLILVSLLCLGACAAPRQAAEPVSLAPGITLALPSPADLGRRIEAVQMVTARRDGESHVFEVRLSVDGERLLLVGTDSLGRRAMTVTWGHGRIAVERADWLPESLRPENVLADIVLIYWPEAVVRQGLSGAGLVQNGDVRRVGEVILVSWRGDPWNGLAHLSNSAWGYELDVRSVVVGP